MTMTTSKEENYCIAGEKEQDSVAKEAGKFVDSMWQNTSNCDLRCAQ